jgi:cell division protein FtsW
LFCSKVFIKTREEPIDFVESLKRTWLPVFITLMFILPSNFSTTALIFAMIIMLVHRYPMKYIGVIVGVGIVSLAFLC